MRITQLSALKYALTSAVATAALLGSMPAHAQDDVLAEVRALRDRLAQLETQVGKEKRRVAAAAAVEAGDKPRSWKLPGTNTSMNIGGYVKFDALVDFTGTPGDAIGISAAPSEGSAADNSGNGGNFRFHARQTRFWIQTWTPTDWGELRTYIETDFFGAGNTLRLRHAYGSLGPVLAGQTWSTFMPVFAGADTLDFGGPTGQIFVRQAQIRYNHNFGGGLVLQLAIEDPTGDAILAATNTTAGTAVGAQRFPDAVAALTYNAAWGQLWAAGIVRQVEHDAGGAAAAGRLASADSAVLWGVAAAGVLRVIPNVEFGFEGSVGTGTGKYLASASGFSDAIVTGFNNLEPIMKYAAKGWVQVKLTDTVSALGAYGWSMQDVDDEVAKRFIAAGTAHYSWSAQGNLQWKPLPQVTFGAEYSHFFGSRYNGPNATVSRIQLSAIYRF